ncbi:NAD(P)-dependent oxidoreductase [Pseudomonas sp. zfem004]|uniref:NAD-dependent epimerase/dehydratase family protein n=1 Tax=unclassified Pseudomonas TaxID=196821 RepID=UPI00129A2785|nr:MULTISPECIES: NAD(P)-dependent oxidoreductase [unclassified Pseudomonas]MDU9404606.1 NAD(P)-dependent oxidoreductase [Pseudomonas sp. zfem004]
MKKQLRILITGAAGLLGSQAIRFFSQNHDVHAIVHNPVAEPIDGVTYHSVDLSSDFDASGLPGQIDAVLHLAQSSKFRDFPAQALDVFNVNVAALAKLLDYARLANCQKFIYASSGGVYQSGLPVVHENSPITSHGELGYYLASKLCGEVLVQNYSSIMDVAVLRFFFIYGEQQRRSMLLPRLVDNVMAGRPVQLQGEDGLVINPVHVSDAVRALETILQAPGSATFNVAGGEEVSIAAICRQIGAALGKQPVFERSSAEAGRLVANISALQALGWSPEVSIEQGLKDLIP